jgi:hypothetical protein
MRRSFLTLIRPDHRQEWPSRNLSSYWPDSRRTQWIVGDDRLGTDPRQVQHCSRCTSGCVRGTLLTCEGYHNRYSKTRLTTRLSLGCDGRSRSLCPRRCFRSRNTTTSAQCRKSSGCSLGQGHVVRSRCNLAADVGAERGPVDDPVQGLVLSAGEESRGRVARGPRRYREFSR